MEQTLIQEKSKQNIDFHSIMISLQHIQVNSADIIDFCRKAMEITCQTMDCSYGYTIIDDPRISKICFSNIHTINNEIIFANSQVEQLIEDVKKEKAAKMIINPVSTVIFSDDCPQTDNNKCSLICLPLINQNSTYGVCGFWTNLNHKNLSPQIIDTIEFILNWMTMHIENTILTKISTIDDLTSIHNFRHFQETLHKETCRNKRHNEHLSLIMIDIDFFKSFNDNYGHQTGDEVLRKVAQSIKEMIRTEDTVARYGGEEFAVILPNTKTTRAFMIAERIRMAIAEQTFMYQGQTLNISISLGTATMPKDTMVPEELVKKADDALYYSKMTGRNKTTNTKMMKNIAVYKNMIAYKSA